MYVRTSYFYSIYFIIRKKRRAENNIEQVTLQEKTKSGKPRMRRKFVESLETRLKEKAR